MRRTLCTSLMMALACGPTAEPVETPGEEPTTETGGENPPAVVEREPPPASGPRRDVAFPEVVRSELDNGLELSTATWSQLPIVYLRLVIRSGTAADPDNLPGLADLVGQMLREGTRSRSSAELAQEIEFLGADLWVSSDEETISVGFRALSEHVDTALELLADVAMNPAFRPDELGNLKTQELNRLQLALQNPNYLAAREFHRRAYGEHPYAHIDTTPDAVERVRRTDLARYHREHFVPNNATLVVVGAVDADAVRAKVDESFGRWRRRDVPEVTYAEAPERTGRQIVIVNRPDSVQSVIRIGNLALPRSSPDYIPLAVANQVLGGSAASRLFMDLRERRSLTYGAYSSISSAVDVGPFQARAAVRTEVTTEAMSAFFEHLDRIVTEAPPADELSNAQRYLSDSFPLRIDTPGKIAWLIGDLRIYGLPVDYWDTYRSRVRAVEPSEALAAAQRYIRPEHALIVIVGKAADFAESLRRYGPVTIVTPAGEVEQELTAADSTRE